MESRKESKRRNDNKRRSLVMAQDEVAESSQRKITKDPKGRKGHVYYTSDYSEPVVRASMPNGSSSLHSETTLPVSAYSSPRPSSPQVPNSNMPNSRPETPQAHSRGASKEPQSRPRTRTLEESRHHREKSPSSSNSKVRARGASLQISTMVDSLKDSSIGYPSIENSPPLEPQPGPHRQPPSKSNPNRPLSPIRNPIAAKPGTPLASSSTDAKKILQLMKTTCGRMHGILSFRTSLTSTWASGYCAINVASGSLIYQTKGEVSLAKTLIPDLRGCQVRTLYDPESRSTFLDVSSRRSTMGVHLRPHVPETFDSWLAALLCWQPIRPKGVQNKMTKPQEASIADRSLGKTGDRSKRNSGNFAKDASIIKVGKMLMYDKDARAGFVSPPPGPRRGNTYTPVKLGSRNWRKISCTLQENGHFKLIAEPESVLEAVIPLSELSRCAVQRLDPSILDDEFSLAIYPQYTSMTTNLAPMHTVYLSMESRVLFEVWFVLLRAFTVPELYGPETLPVNARSEPLDTSTAAAKPPISDMFRIERLFSLKIVEANLHSAVNPFTQGTSAQPAGESSQQNPVVGNYYAELQLDSEVRARTAVKKDTSAPFWREEFEFVDLPPVISSAVIEVKTRNPGQKDWILAHAPLDLEKGNMNPHTIEGDIEVSPLDLTYGKVDLRLNDVERATETEKWWPILDEQDGVVGDVLMKVRIEELVVLMGRDYAPISELLHTFPNGLTNQITQMAHGELKRLSEILLNIFQVSGHASAWLMSLVEDEIDSVHRETPVSKFRYNRRIASNDSFESGVEREMFLRDLGKNASVEANLLFRGNSLLTKALDLHMRRLGKEYLEDTLSEKMRDINESDPECEVDPNRVGNHDVERNWRNLKALTENIWSSIAVSASRCPPELRIIMRRIRDCAEDRYGDFHRSVAYSSVSGFLFLRFFTPAVLNPKLFGLLKDHPRPRAQRTLTLITKTLQTLANMTTFGVKEPWMEPMNVFLTTHRQEFKAFVDEICDISSDRATSAIPPSYATPITILGRLPGTSREGFPSLPYLIDQARECACLVDVWLSAKYDIDGTAGWSEELKRFDELCELSRKKGTKCLTRAEQAERPSGVLEPRWEELVEQMERKARLKEANGHDSPSTPTNGEGGNSQTVNSSTSSLADSYFPRSAIPRPRHSEGRQYPLGGYLRLVPTSPHSPVSPDEATSSEMDSETTNTPPGSSSGIWDPAQSPRMEDPAANSSENDDLGIENSTDVLGSSIYNLTPGKSKRDSDATAKAVPVPTTMRSAHGSKSSKSSKSSHGPKGQRKGPRSAYGLRHSSEREDISKSLSKPKSTSQSTDDPGPSSERSGKGLYRLNASSGFQQAGDSSASLGRRSPSSREGKGGLSNSMFGGVFRKKVRERDKERARDREDGY